MNLANLTLLSVQAVIILDSEGNRICAKYYTEIKDQKELEKSLFEKTKRAPTDVVLFQNMLVLYKNVVDLFIYVLGGTDENELLLGSALNGFQEALNILLKNQVERRTVMDSMDVVLLCLDETIDDGIILETDPSIISSRVTKRGVELENIPIADQTISQVWRQAQEQLTRSFLK